MNYELLAIFIAYILDLILGDPQWQWHPVRFIGRLIEFLEERLNPYHNISPHPLPSKPRRYVGVRSHCTSPRRGEGCGEGYNKKSAGIMLLIIVVSLTVSCVWVILRLAGSVHPVFYYFVLTLCIYFGLSVKSLAVEANKVKNALIREDITEAREKLSMIVGRDTANLGKTEIIRATVETVAESITDGITAPIFYCFLGGPCLMWAYKAVNTLDSMVGYQNKRFKKFGWACAKLDGLMNFVPSRISSVLIAVSSFFLGKYTFNSIKWAVRYFFSGTQDNSQLTEAAMAGAIGIQLGGVNFYNSVPAVRPYIGDALHLLEIKYIRETIKVSYFCSALMVFAGIAFR